MENSPAWPATPVQESRVAVVDLAAQRAAAPDHLRRRDAGDARAWRAEPRVRHAERRVEPPLHEPIERLAAHPADHLAEHDEAGVAVDERTSPGAKASPLCAWSLAAVGNPRAMASREGRSGRPAGVRQQAPDGHVAEGRRVELLHVAAERRLEVDPPLLPQHQDGRRRRHDLGERGDVEDRVDRHRLRHRDQGARAEGLADTRCGPPAPPGSPRRAPRWRRPRRGRRCRARARSAASARCRRLAGRRATRRRSRRARPRRALGRAAGAWPHDTDGVPRRRRNSLCYDSTNHAARVRHGRHGLRRQARAAGAPRARLLRSLPRPPRLRGGSEGLRRDRRVPGDVLQPDDALGERGGLRRRGAPGRHHPRAAAPAASRSSGSTSTRRPTCCAWQRRRASGATCT